MGKGIMDDVVEASGGGFLFEEKTTFGSPCPSACLESQSEIKVEITTDRFPSETSWELIDLCSSTTVGSYPGDDNLDDDYMGDDYSYNDYNASDTDGVNDYYPMRRRLGRDYTAY